MTNRRGIILAGGAGTRLLDHRRAGVDPYYTPAGSYQLCEILHIIARSAAHIQQSRSWPHIEEIKHALPVNARRL